MIFGNRKRGFTLVEMLIVIVIIGVLAGALIPRLTSARARANDSARKADLSQIATAILAYQIDSNGYLPVPAVTGYSVSSIEPFLTTAGMDGVPQDPMPNSQFDFSGGSLPVETGQYGYIRIIKDGALDTWFVLMAKTQTAGGSNRVTDGNIGAINEQSSANEIVPCKVIVKSGAVSLIPGGSCTYTLVSQLRYIIAR